VSLKDEYCDEIRVTARTLNVVKMPVMDNGKGRVNTYMSLRDKGCVHNTKCKKNCSFVNSTNFLTFTEQIQLLGRPVRGSLYFDSFTS